MEYLYYVAARINPDEVGIPKVGSNDVLSGLLNAVYLFAGLASVVVIIIAGIIYVVSEGDATKVKRAREAIIYALVGLVFIMFAFVITNFVIGRF